MRRGLVIGLLGLLVAGGCVSTAAKQAFSGVTGASDRCFEVESLGGEQSLLGYRSVRVEKFDASLMRGAIPHDVLAAVQPAIQMKVAELEPFAAGGEAKPVLVIRGKFHDYDPGGSALRAVGFSGNPFLTAQIELVDGASGKVLGVAMVTGTIKSIVRTGAKELADGVAKAVKSLLEAHMKRPEE